MDERTDGHADYYMAALRGHNNYMRLYIYDYKIMMD